MEPCVRLWNVRMIYMTSDSTDKQLVPGQLDPAVETALHAADISYQAMECDPNLADTAAFCEAYGFTAEQSANTILVAGKPRDKTLPLSFAACVVRADTRLDVNKAVCKQMGVKRASFASADQTKELTGMMIGGVTAFGLPDDIPIYIDGAVMEPPEVVMGGGNRSSKVILDPQELRKLPNVSIIDDLAKRAG